MGFIDSVHTSLLNLCKELNIELVEWKDSEIPEVNPYQNEANKMCKYGTYYHERDKQWLYTWFNKIVK